MTTHPPPRPLHLANSAQRISSNDALATPPPSTLRNPKRFSLATSSPSSSTPRRQSSISYYPPESISCPRRGPLLRRNSLGTINGGAVGPEQRTGGESHERGKPDIASPPTTPPSVPGTPAPKERPPLTLTEKHADLLHFIAQKESKCLELRSQLAIHEAELLQLKRKWERIVNRGLERDLGNDPTTPTTNGAITTPTVLEGLKESMQGMSRLLAGSFSTTDPEPSSHVKSFSVSASTHQREQKQKPPSLSPSIRKSHLARESDSSISTYATKSTTRFSQSSVSSFGGDFVSESPIDLGNTEEETGASSDDAQVLMVRDTGATPTMSPNPEFHKQKFKKQQQPKFSPPLQAFHGGAAGKDKTGPGMDADVGTWTSSSSVKATKAHRRRSRDASMRLDLEHMDFSTLSPSVLLSPPSRMANANPSSRSASPLIGITKETRSADVSKRSSLNLSANSGVMGGLPPMSSIPGLSSLATGVVSPPPVSSWMDSMGKKLGELQRSSTFTKNQKRASLLLADVSQSIVSVLTSSPSPSMTTPVAGIDTGGCVSAKSSLGAVSLLDDDDDTVKFNSTLLVAEKAEQRQVRPGTNLVIGNGGMERSRGQVSRGAKQVGDDAEEWNW